MKHLAIIPALTAVSACAPLPDDFAGEVTSFNGSMVEIVGPWDGTANFQPTPAMTEQARRLCGPRAALFVGGSTRDDGSFAIHGTYGSTYVTGSDPWPMTVFKFACVNP